MHPPPSPAQANFTLITECTPQSRRYYSVYSVDQHHIDADPVPTDPTFHSDADPDPSFQRKAHILEKALKGTVQRDGSG